MEEVRGWETIIRICCILKIYFQLQKEKMGFSNFSLDEIKYNYEICVLISKDCIIKYPNDYK